MYNDQVDQRGGRKGNEDREEQELIQLWKEKRIKPLPRELLHLLAWGQTFQYALLLRRMHAGYAEQLERALNGDVEKRFSVSAAAPDIHPGLTLQGVLLVSSYALAWTTTWLAGMPCCSSSSAA